VEHILKVSENELVRKIFTSKRDEVTRDYRQSHNEELHNLYFSPNIMAFKSERNGWSMM
jgi:hypothetical protein